MFGVAMMSSLARLNGIPLLGILSLGDTQFIRDAAAHGFAAILLLVPAIDFGLDLAACFRSGGFIRLFFHKFAG